MIQIVAMDGINIHKYATDYSVDFTRIESDNAFKAANGKEIKKLMGHKAVISCTLKKVPHAEAQEIAKIVKQDSFELTYTTPLELTNQFKCTRYNPTPKCADPRQKNPLITDKMTWNILLTLESASIADENDGDGL